MKFPPRTIVLYALLAATTLAALVAYFRYAEARQELATYRVEAKLQDSSLDRNFITRLSAIDSLLLAGQYGQARRAYQALGEAMPDQALFRRVVQRRLDQVRKLTRMSETLRAMEGEDLAAELTAKNQAIDSLLTQVALARRNRSDQIDSLRFALEKAKTRLDILAQQLDQASESGYLTFTNQAGTTVNYVGEIEDDKANGRGVGLYATGSRYEGEWRDNQRHGQGTFYWPDGEYYQGQFRQDERHGQGSYHWPNGERFTGTWEDDQRNGQGTFFGKDGKVVASGIWKNNELVDKE